MVALAQQPNTPVKSNEWYTPRRYIEAAREVMGSIDLDPASSVLANETVKASRYYTKEDNGLEQSWYGNVWLNPPFLRTNVMKGKHQTTIGLFTAKLLEEYSQGDVTQAILLATCKQEARWFQPMWEYLICFPDHYVRFNRPFDGTMSNYAQMFGTIFVYLGPNEQKFIDVFSEFGTVAKRVSTPKPKQTPLSLWEVQ